MRILVTDGMDKTAMAELREMGHEVVEQFYEPDQLGKALRDFDVVVVRSKTKVRANHIDEAKGSQLKLIIRGGVGVDNIDVDYAKQNGIDVKNTPKASSQSVAELAMGHMFSCARYISIAGHTMREDKWEKKAYGKGIELQGKTLGIVGFGRIGQHLGVMAKAIGMKVVAFDIFHIPGIEEQLGIPYVEMDELLAMSDFVSVHAPAVDGGALISAENIAKMKDGVVVINTKRGVKDRTVVTVSNSTTFSKVYRLPDMQNSYGTSSGLMNWGEKSASTFDAKKFFNTGTNIINSVSVSTGNEKNQTYISASTTNTAGIIPENTYDRYNFTARNTTSFAKDKLVLDLGASFIIQHDENMVTQGKYYNPLPALYLFPRSDDFDEIRLFERWDPVRGYMVQYWPYGEGAHSLQNPYWIQNRMNRETSKRRYMLNASLRWNITDWMNVSGRVRVDNSEYRIKQKLYASTLTTFCGTNGGYEDQTQHDRSFYGDVMLNIDKTFGDDWTLNANIGASINDQRYEQAGVAGDLLLTNHFAMNNLNYQEKFKPLQEGWHDQTQAIFASVEVGWRSMLYLTVTGRNDWASQLAYSKNSSFFYPSVGLSAVVSNMVNMPEWFTFLKVRGSYSKVASAFARYLSNPAYSFNNQTHNWSKPSTYPAYNLKPEDTKSWEIGLNARFLNHINLDVTYYRSNTYHQTIYAPLPSSSGYNQVVVQAGDVQNQGVELALGYNNKWNDFTWSSSYTFTLNRNEIKRLAAGEVNPVTGETITDNEIQKDWLGASNVAPQVILRPGGSMSDIYVNHELKRDLNGNIEIDPSTGNLSIAETDFRKVGQLSPRYTMGWSNSFGYKGIELGAVLTARIGGLTYSATQGVLDYYGASQATADARDRGGIPINYGTVDPQKYYSAISTAEGGYGAYYLYSATNVRLQELSLQYTLPARWFRNKARLTVGFVAKNLWMIYCKAPFDPEISAATDNAYYQGVDYFMQPSTRNFGFNVKLQF